LLGYVTHARMYVPFHSGTLMIKQSTTCYY
jgi:hypothetical protein